MTEIKFQTPTERIADLESQLAEATAEIKNQKVTEGVADSYAAVLEADNGALVDSLQDHWIEICDVGEACLFCEAAVTYKDEITQLQPQCNHESNCILEAKHPGSRLLEQVKLAEKCIEVLTKTPDVYEKQYLTFTTRQAAGIAVNEWEKFIIDTIPEALAAYAEAKETKL